MTGGQNGPGTGFEEASSQLDQGLKVCRAVLDNYRAMLVGDNGIAAEQAANDDGFADGSEAAADEA